MAVPRPENVRPRAYILLAAIPNALSKLTRRLDELRSLEEPKSDTDFMGLSRLIADKINTTIEEVFGDDTAEAHRFRVDRLWFLTNVSSKRIEEFCGGRDRAIAVIEAAIEWLKEKLADAEEDATGKTLRAYEGLDLHPEIARAASDLYRDGHYANAVEASVKALNRLVRLRSELELDGMSLMEKAFSPNSPILKFNDLSDRRSRRAEGVHDDVFRGGIRA
jgi:uncharacterized protein Ymh